MEAHILPQVLLRGFRVDLPEGEKDTKDRDKARVDIFYRNTGIYTKNEFISEISTKTDFYGDEIENFLRYRFETPFGNLKIKLNDYKNPRYARISTNDFELLLTFSANMWRRSDTHLTSKYRNQELSENDLKKILYSKETLDIDKNSPIFLKTTLCYETFIIFNETFIKFPLHNKHATIRNYEKVYMFPEYIFEPVNKNIMMIHKRRSDFMSQNRKVYFGKTPNFMNEDKIKIQTRMISDEVTIKNIIRTYCLIESPVDYYICDETNVVLIRELYEDLNISLKATKEFKDKFSKYIFS